MAMEALDVRIARLEGGYEQMDKRLSNLESEIRALRQDVHTLFWRLVLLMLGSWITLMAAIFLRR